MTISRRQFVSSVAGAGIASMAAPNLVLAQGSGPIRVGLLAAKTGPLASGGIDMELALTMFLKERDNTLAGRKVELIVADTAGVPATARTKAQELIEKNNVHCIIGPLAAFEALAIADYLTEKEVPTLGVAAAEDMTQRHPSPWFVRLTSTSAQCAYPLAEYSAKELKYKKIVTIADDFAYGHEMCAGFQRAFEDNGGKIIQKIFTPLATPGLRHLCRSGEERGRHLSRHRRIERIPFPSSIHRIRPEGQDGRDRRHDGARRIRASQHGRRSAGDYHHELVFRRAGQSPQQGVRAGIPQAVQIRPRLLCRQHLRLRRSPGSCTKDHQRKCGGQESANGGDPRQQRRYGARSSSSSTNSAMRSAMFTSAR